ncbi:ATP-binding protein [Occultella kanbiaonis]|uniref:ATP-binding protein n=1 Tax=Occultella kanbiaonis TaxID=2675754 RepID=UPI0013D0B778|nr:ATP-binding protein [Occultella kanbiaonis]
MSALTLGTVMQGGDVGSVGAIDPRKLNRHTFWCGQSGSGKTYSLGVLLEQILLHTSLPLLILDPNADYVHLGTPREGADAAEASALAGLDIRVRSAGGRSGSDPLRVRYAEMVALARAAVLRLEPLRDAAEYHAALEVLAESTQAPNRATLVTALLESDDPARQLLGLRLDNLGILDWDVWAWQNRSAEDELDDRPDAVVLDLSACAQVEEPAAVSLAVLDHLWRQREQRRPITIVIDEAHNVCPASPDTPLQRALVDRVIQIAAEGRKYGLWLVLSTQRPNKIHPQVLTQCDNLGLLRMNSPADLAEVASVFGFAPRDLLDASPSFAQGQVLLAGGFAAEPAVVQMRDRICLEGGADVAVPLSPRNPSARLREPT